MPNNRNQVRIEPHQLDQAILSVARTIPEYRGNQTAKEFQTFAQDWPTQRAKIIQDLDAGKYQPSEAYGFVLKKPGKNGRPISVSHFRDRIVLYCLLRQLNQQLLEQVRTLSCYSLKAPTRKKQHASSYQSMREAVEELRKAKRSQKWIFESDIISFFPSINLKTLSDQLQLLGLTEAQTALTLSFVSVDISNYKSLKTAHSAEWEEWWWHPNLGVPQGNILSPLLSSVYLATFDHTIEKHGLKMIRYVDDLVVICDSEEEAHRAHDTVIDELRKLGLSMHTLADESKKCRIVAPDQDIQFLGILVSHGGNAMPTEKACSNFKLKVSQICSDEDSTQTISELQQKLNGLVIGWGEAYRPWLHCYKLKDSLDSVLREEIQKWFKKRGVIGLDEILRNFLVARALGFYSLNDVIDKRIQREKLKIPKSLKKSKLKVKLDT